MPGDQSRLQIYNNKRGKKITGHKCPLEGTLMPLTIDYAQFCKINSPIIAKVKNFSISLVV